MKRYLTTACLLLTTLAICAQMANPVHFSSSLKMLKGNEAEIMFTASIDAGWHVYSTDLGNDGPISATFNVVKMDGAEAVGKLQPRGKETKQYDQIFGMDLRFFEHAATFAQRVRFTKPDYDIDCYLEYGACNDESCLPPSEAPFKAKGKSPAADQKDVEAAKPDVIADQLKAMPDTAAAEPMNADSAATTAATASASDLWAPVVSELQSMGGTDDIGSRSLLYILLMGFVGGLLAVCMPCIWPIIPMTVSFFLKRAKTDKRKGIRDAMTYGLSIVVIYLALGLIVTALFGSDTLNAMSTNAVFNIFLFLLLVVFALSFFGWFEIKLPDSWASRQESRRTVGKDDSKFFTLNASRFIEHLPDGVYPGARIVFVYGAHHRPAARRDHHQRQLVVASHRHVRFRLGSGSAVHAVCTVSCLAETGPEIGVVDEHAESGAGLH